MMNYGTLDSVEFVKIFEQLISNLETQISADDVISAINSKISQFDQKITKYTYDLTNEVFYIFHATAETSMSKIQHSYNASEVEYFKNLFIKITEDDHVRISPLDALNLSGKLLSKVRAQRLLENWTQEAYFQQIDGEDYFYIGPKLLIEFKDLMISLELSHIKCCLLCESIAIWVSWKIGFVNAI